MIEFIRYMNNKKLLMSLGVVLVASAFFSLLFIGQHDTYAYTIPNVEPYTLYDGRVLDAGVTSPFEAQIYSVLAYWGVPASLNDVTTRSELNTILNHGNVNFSALKSFLNARGLQMNAMYLPGTKDLEKYINPDQPVPLLFLQLFSDTRLDLYDYQLLVGLDLKKGNVIVNSYMHGPLYEVPLAQFQRLWDLDTSEASKFRYIIIEPKDLSAMSSRIQKNAMVPKYPTRTAPMDDLQPLFTSYMLNERTVTDVAWSNRLNQMISSSVFKEFHPIIQVTLYDGAARYALAQNDYPSAFTAIQSALKLNQNLDAPFPGWGTVSFKESSEPYYLLFRYYTLQKNKSEADKAYANYIHLNQTWKNAPSVLGN